MSANLVTVWSHHLVLTNYLPGLNAVRVVRHMACSAFIVRKGISTDAKNINAY